MDNESSTRRFFEAATRGDSASMLAMCRPDVVFRQNAGDEGGAVDLAALVDGIAAAGVEVRYADVRRVVAGAAVVEEHDVVLRGADGVEATGRACVVLRFDETGMIERLDEYVDPTPLAAFLG